MKNVTKKYAAFILTILFVLASVMIYDLLNQQPLKKAEMVRAKSTSSPKALMEGKKARAEYFFMMLRDPATNSIPPAIRERELAYAKKLAERGLHLRKSAVSFNWKEGGPYDVGGRTRALAIDVTNSNTILAGGISGGMWKSTDNGATWKIKSTPVQVLSVTSVAQDRRPGYTNNWYYVSGEFDGSSAIDLGSTAYFKGGGVYKSTDNGETWNVLPGTVSKDITKWTGIYDYCFKVMVSAKGNLFIATAGVGILRSTDAGNSFTSVLGDINEHLYSDIDETSDGRLVAVISSPYQGGTSKKEPGIYRSNDEGASWTKITPAGFPAQHKRSRITSAPSNPDVAYVFTNTGIQKNNRDDIRFYKLNIVSGAAEDRSANMPDFGANHQDYISTQNNYNMTLAVKPDNENLVIIGATSLFRSFDGFAHKPDNAKLNWIGGYNPVTFFYPGLHPDIHSFAFDPKDPKKVWWGHDGGLSYTTDITTTDYDAYFPWEKKNNGYNVTQFYQIAIPDIPNDNRIAGGTQDNGTPFFTCDGITTGKSQDVSSGDGGYAYFGKKYLYTEFQMGNIHRYGYNEAGFPYGNVSYAFITPTDARNQLFICPYAVDPSNEDIMYYPTANEIWRNNQLGSIPNGTNKTMQGWSKIAAVNVPQGYMISALNVSKNNPSSLLYYAISSYQAAPKIFKLLSAQTASDGIQEISIPGAAQGSYVHHIAVNPDNGNEIMVVMSNYNIVGAYHSSNGGKNYTAIEGNLEGDKDNPGPSLRCASILPTDKGTVYLLATSIGLFSAANLNGAATQWVQESPSEIGNTVIDFIASRKSDGRIVAATHGRGIFVSTGTGTKAIASVNESSLKIQAKPGASASTSFVLQNKGTADLNYNITIAGGANGSPGISGKEFKGIVPETGFYQMNKALSPKPYDKYKMMRSGNSGRLIGTDILMLDDGNDVPDIFYGYGMGSGFSYANEFNLSGFDFKLDAVQVYFRSESSPINGAGYAVLDDSLNIIYYGFKSLENSTNGMWFTLPLDTTFTFKNGQRFFLQVDASNMADYPGGFDNNAKVKNKSYYISLGTLQLKNMNTVTGAENGAFLIRAAGTKITGGTNKPPVPVATISNTNVKTGQAVTFDASGSYDPDGQIVSYVWNFGDGASSDQKVAVHSYSQPGTYKVTIKVTDNQGATGQAEGQVNVTAGGTVKLTVDPLSGTIAPGSEKTITVTLNAEGAAEGTYQANIIINSNGGNITIPVEIVISNAVAVNEKNINSQDYALYQNYPNPFNPETVISFRIKEDEVVTMKIYDINGKEISMPLNQFMKKGEHKIKFNAQKLSSGVYYYILTTGKFKDGKKMLVIK